METETILLSIKPMYVEMIFSGEKKFEFRTVMPAKHPVHRVIIYASAPVSAIVGEFTVVGCGRCSPVSMWGFTVFAAGITRQEFFDYFNGYQVAQCYIIGSYIKYQEPVSLSYIGLIRPPQNFIYLPNQTLQNYAQSSVIKRTPEALRAARRR